MVRLPDVLNVYQTGTLTVVGFRSREFLDNDVFVAVQAQLAELIQQHDCHVLGFDLAGIEQFPSGVFGWFAALRRLGVNVRLYNAADAVRDVLCVTRLEKLVEVSDDKPPGHPL